MARIEKTVFISYRRKDISWALTVYQDLTYQGYDVFFDYTSIPSGDFEQIIISNIKARAHFVLILTPTTFDRCSEPGDWLRCEIETAIDEKRNIVPLFFDGFSFGAAKVSEKLTGKLKNVSRYNGLNVHQDYFYEAMERLRLKFLNVPLDSVLQPVSAEVLKAVKGEQLAANEAILQNFPERPAIQQKPIIETPEPEEKAKSSSEPTRVNPVFKRVNQATETLQTLPEEKKPLIEAPLLKKEEKTIAEKKSVIETPLPKRKEELVVAKKPIIEVHLLKKEEKTIVEKKSVIEVPKPAKVVTPPNKITLSNGMEFMRVPAGVFWMGSENLFSGEEPRHLVNISYDYWMARFSVTNELYYAYVKAHKGIKHPADGWFSSWEKKKDHPVVSVKWADVRAYCLWLNNLFKDELRSKLVLRLPTEAEWEKAARGIDGREYPWGNTFEKNKCNTIEDGKNSTTPVEFYSPLGDSPFGCADMVGNVWEMTHSLKKEYPYKVNDGREEENAIGDRVARGCSYKGDKRLARCSCRWSFDIYATYAGIGFRVVIAPKLPKK